MAGPITFASDKPKDDKGPTEFGGRAGLVAGELVSGVVGEARELTGPEKRGVLVRGVGVTVVDPVTGLVVVDEQAMAIDPATGLLVDVWNEDGKVVAPVDVPLRTANPDAAEV